MSGTIATVKIVGYVMMTLTYGGEAHFSNPTDKATCEAAVKAFYDEFFPSCPNGCTGMIFGFSPKSAQCLPKESE